MKRRFEFKLARLLRVRTIQEEVARAEWAAAEAEATRAESELEALHSNLRAERRRLGHRLAGRLTGANVLSSHAALDAQLVALEQAAASARQARKRADVLVQAWRAREQERRALVELHERGRARHRRELERDEEETRDAIFQGRLALDSQGNSSAAPSRTDGTRTKDSPFPRTSEPQPAYPQAP